ncbi:hypothetical protein [Pseudomonas sp.]|uniref:hypothetical protein n=1 Tax=Pseudomonas sp. TaxID=306 RepID=UPI00258880E2|nr:hypothetical protein [Pseudomonas sp.]
MSKIICVLENASDLINGIKFGPEEGVEGLVSEEVSESVAALFLSIPGYVLHGAEGEEGGDTNTADPEPPAAPAPKKETAAERKARLKAEADAAEQAAAEEEAAKKAAEEPAENADAGNGESDNEVF